MILQTKCRSTLPLMRFSYSKPLHLSLSTSFLARTVTGLAHVGAAGVVHARRALAGAVHKVALVRHVAGSARLCIPHLKSLTRKPPKI